MPKIHLVGILNVTPDSFSDGGRYLDPQKALNKAQSLIENGADLIDIGADSTRPGSECVGSKIEQERLEPVLSLLSDYKIPFAVDTHIAETAQFAIEHGASMINDVSGGYDSEMFSVISKSNTENKVKYVLMYSRCTPPHEFSEESDGNILKVIKGFFEEKIDLALQAGVDREQIILDTGMGKFISDSPQRSWQVARGFAELSDLQLPLYIGASRKGFLKLPLETCVEERDYLSAYIGKLAAQSLPENQQLFIRTHNILMQKQLLS